MTLPAFTIKTLDRSVNWTLILTGRALPYRPITLEGTQELEVVWYPGFPQATAQALGPHEEKTTIKGFWKDRFLQYAAGDAPIAEFRGSGVDSAAQLIEDADSIRRLGYMVEVTWQNVKRIGFITKLTQSWHTIHDCEWEMEFTWTGREEVFIQSNLPPVQNYTDYANRLTTALVDSGAYQSITAGITRLNSAVATANSATQDAATAMSLALGQIANATQALVNLSQNVATVAQAGAGAVSQATGILSGLSRSYTIIADAMDRNASAIKFGYSQAALYRTGGNTFAAQLAADTEYSNATSALRGLAQESTALAQQSKTTETPAPDWIYVASDGDDLRRVATLYYGDPAAWVFLAEYNGLSSSLLVAGQQVNVPPAAQPRAA